MVVRTYDEVAERVITAIEEFNAALQEAYDMPDLNVWIKEESRIPRQLGYIICKSTHTSKRLSDDLSGQQMWMVLKTKGGESLKDIIADAFKNQKKEQKDD